MLLAKRQRQKKNPESLFLNNNFLNKYNLLVPFGAAVMWLVKINGHYLCRKIEKNRQRQTLVERLSPQEAIGFKFKSTPPSPECSCSACVNLFHSDNHNLILLKILVRPLFFANGKNIGMTSETRRKKRCWTQIGSRSLWHAQQSAQWQTLYQNRNTMIYERRANAYRSLSNCEPSWNLTMASVVLALLSDCAAVMAHFRRNRKKSSWEVSTRRRKKKKICPNITLQPVQVVSIALLRWKLILQKKKNPLVDSFHEIVKRK